jgi:hypothetical protein
MALPFPQAAAVSASASEPVTLVASGHINAVSLAEARTFADTLWQGAVQPHTHWSVRQGYIAQLHTFVYHLLDERQHTAKQLRRHSRGLLALRQMVGLDRVGLENATVDFGNRLIVEARIQREVLIVTTGGGR